MTSQQIRHYRHGRNASVLARRPALGLGAVLGVTALGLGSSYSAAGLASHTEASWIGGANALGLFETSSLPAVAAVQCGEGSQELGSEAREVLLLDGEPVDEQIPETSLYTTDGEDALPVQWQHVDGVQTHYVVVPDPGTAGEPVAADAESYETDVSAAAVGASETLDPLSIDVRSAYLVDGTITWEEPAAEPLVVAVAQVDLPEEGSSTIYSCDAALIGQTFSVAEEEDDSEDEEEDEEPDATEPEDADPEEQNPEEEPGTDDEGSDEQAPEEESPEEGEPEPSPGNPEEDDDASEDEEDESDPSSPEGDEPTESASPSPTGDPEDAEQEE